MGSQDLADGPRSEAGIAPFDYDPQSFDYAQERGSPLRVLTPFHDLPRLPEIGGLENEQKVSTFWSGK